MPSKKKLQKEFNQTIGELDYVLSKLIYWSKITKRHLAAPNKKTLKHHAEDMIGAGQKILTNLVDSPTPTHQKTTQPGA